MPPGQIIGNNGNNGQSEPFRYFFHPDHLGSTSYITDATGEVYQHLEYFAFGETFVEERGNTDKLPYKFNGKELDEETGLYYYGARYYDAQTSVWLSVDPKMDKYPGWSAYNYTFNNPLIYTDPDGKDAEVKIKGNTITISTTIYIYGSGASKTTANLMEQNIMKAWSKDQNGKNWTYKDSKTGESYNVIFNVKVEQYDNSNKNNKPGLFSGKNNPLNTDNYVEVDNNAKRSFVRGGDEGVWRGKGRYNIPLAKDDSAPHEFGHILGLPDEYTNGKGANTGWIGNIMAEPAMKGNVEQKNINQLLLPVINEYNDSYTKSINENLGTNIEYKTKIDP